MDKSEAVNNLAGINSWLPIIILHRIVDHVAGIRAPIIT